MNKFAVSYSILDCVFELNKPAPRVHDVLLYLELSILSTTVLDRTYTLTYQTRRLLWCNAVHNKWLPYFDGNVYIAPLTTSTSD